MISGFFTGALPLNPHFSIITKKKKGTCPICHNGLVSKEWFSHCDCCGAPIDWMTATSQAQREYHNNGSCYLTVDSLNSISSFLSKLRTFNGKSFTWKRLENCSYGDYNYAYQLYLDESPSIIIYFRIINGMESLYAPAGLKLDDED